MSIITKLQQLFSPPEPKELLGVSLRQQSVNFCLVNEDDSFSCESIDIASGQNSQGLSLLKDSFELQGQCHLVLNASQNQIVQVDKPNVPANEINSAVKWQIKDLVSIAPENMIVDYYDGPTLAGGLEKINVVCAAKNELTDYVSALANNAIKLQTITTEEFAFASLLPVKDDACLLICQQPNEEMNLLIVKQGRLYFQRRLRGLAQIAQKSEDELAMGTIDSLSLEIQRSTDYFERQLKQSAIRSIEVLVPMKSEAFLARKLSENTNVPVNIFAMPDGYADHREYAAAIGATLLSNSESEK